MKTIICLFTVLCSSFGFSQDFQGMAVYESKLSLPSDLNIGEDAASLDPEISEAIMSQIQLASHNSYVLNFNKEASIYEIEEKLEPESAMSISVSVSSSDGEGIQYKNVKNKTMTIENVFYDKEFLIVDSLPRLEWKLTDEKKKIGNYNCFKAVASIKNADAPENTGEKGATSFFKDMPKERRITAWYTPDIPVSQGPEMYWGLPGLILEVQDDHMSLLCSKVVLNSAKKKEIKAPKKGKKVTKAEYDKITRKKMEELYQMNGRDGKIIRIETH